MTDGWYGPARENLAPSNGGTHLGPVTIGVLHTTESTRFAPRRGDYFGHQSYPHFTVAVVAGEFVVWQHITIRRAARALKNRSGGVQTNREGCVQIEVVGSATRPFTDDEVMVKGLSRLMRWIESQTSIPRASGVRFRSYPGSYGTGNRVRLSNGDWQAYRGWLGHQHVPENDHGDPGAIDISKLLAVPAAPLDVQEDDKMYAVISDPRTGGDYGTDGLVKFPFPSQLAKNDWAKAFKAERVVLSPDAFDAIPTVGAK